MVQFSTKSSFASASHCRLFSNHARFPDAVKSPPPPPPFLTLQAFPDCTPLFGGIKLQTANHNLS